MLITAGLKFWKVNSRKFFAVPEEDLLAPCRKKSRKSVDDQEQNCNCTDALSDLADEFALFHKKIDRVFELTKDTPNPPGIADFAK